MLLAYSSPAEVSAPTFGPLVQGGTIRVPNPYGATATSWEEIPSGSPTSVSVTIQGCMRGGTCDAIADTNTSTSAAIRGVVFTKPYTFFLVTVGTLSGGTNPTITVNAFLVH
jgi:hypothetical protein